MYKDFTFKIDDIDHLGNRRVRGIGELLENQVRIGLSQMAKIVRDKMTKENGKKKAIKQFSIPSRIDINCDRIKKLLQGKVLKNIIDEIPRIFTSIPLPSHHQGCSWVHNVEHY